MVQHGLPSLDRNSFPHVYHPVCCQGIDGGHNSRVGVLVGAAEPALICDTDPGRAMRGWNRRLDGWAWCMMIGGAFKAVFSLPHGAHASPTARRRVGPGATRLRRPAFLGHSPDLRGGGWWMVRGSGRASRKWTRQERGRLGRNTGRLPGRVLRGIVVVIEAGLIRRCLRVTAARWNAACRAEAAGVTIAISIGQSQRHNGVHAPFDDLVLAAALLHLVFRILAVGSNFNARAF